MEMFLLQLLQRCNMLTQFHFRKRYLAFVHYHSYLIPWYLQNAAVIIAW